LVLKYRILPKPRGDPETSEMSKASDATVEVVRKKAAPKGPPPVSMAAFKPKHVEARTDVASSEHSDEDISPEKDRVRGRAPHSATDLYDTYSAKDDVRGLQIRPTGKILDRDRSRSRSGSRSNSREGHRDQRRRGDSDEESSSRSYNSGDEDSRSHQSGDSEYCSDEDRDSRERAKTSRGEKVKTKAKARSYDDEASDDEAQPKAASRSVDRKRSDQDRREESKPIRNNVAAPARAEAKPSKSAESWTEVLGKVRPGKEGVFNYSEVLKCTYRDLKKFLLQPVERGYVYRCYIERNRSGLNAFAPFYSLCADLDDGTGRELIVCRKVIRSQTPHYVFSLKMEDLWRDREQRSRLFLGKLRQVSSGEYVLFDSGAQPPSDYVSDSKPSAKTETADTTSSAASAESSLYRKELMLACYTDKKRPSETTALEVCIPNPTTAPRAEGDLLDAVGSKTSMAPNFTAIRSSGKQNELFADKYFILHEKQSR